MSGVTALDREVSQRLATLTRQRYDAARASGWSPEPVAALLRQTLDTVTIYLAEAPTDAHARVYLALLLDLAAGLGAEELAGWPETDLRAARLAATRGLSDPSRPDQRPRAQALLKRLDLVQDPLLQARERLSIEVSRRLADLPIEASNPHQDAFRADIALRAVARRLGHMPLPAPDSEAHAHALAQLVALRQLCAESDLLSGAPQRAIFEAMQRLAAPFGAPMPLEQALEALRQLERAPDPDGWLRNAIIRLVFRLDLALPGAADRGALSQLLTRLPAMHRRLASASRDEREAGLLRLRHELQTPSDPALEPRLERLVGWLSSLTARRDAAQARLARAMATVEPDKAVQGARARLRQVERLRDALLEVEACRLSPVGEAALEKTCKDLDRMAGEPFWDAETFEVLLADLRRRLEAPELTAQSWFLLLQRHLQALEAAQAELVLDGPSRALLAKARFALQGIATRGRAGEATSVALEGLGRALDGLRETGEASALTDSVTGLLALLGTPSG